MYEISNWARKYCITSHASLPVSRSPCHTDNRDSPVITVTAYGLDDQQDRSLHLAHPAPYLLGTGLSGRSVTLITHLHQLQRLIMRAAVTTLVHTFMVAWCFVHHKQLSPPLLLLQYNRRSVLINYPKN